MNRFTRYLIPSLADILFISVFLYISFVPDRGLLGDGDTGYHIRAGEYILDNLSLPQIDPFSFRTPPLAWTVHEWLSEVIMALAHRLAGLSGVVVLYALILAATFHSVVKVLKAEGSTAVTAATATIIIMAASMVHWLARPHLFSLLLLVPWLHIVHSYEQGSRNRLYLLPPLMLLWVNLHGGFIIGFVLLGIYLAGTCALAFFDTEAWLGGGMKRAKQYAATFGICTAAALINPCGWNIFLFPFKLVLDTYQMDHTAEFLSPNFHEQPLFKALLLLLILFLSFSGKRPSLIQGGLILFFTNMALSSVRYIPLFALVTVPVMLRCLDFNLDGHFPRIRSFFAQRVATAATLDALSRGCIWPCAAVLLVSAQLYCGTISHGFDPDKKAVAAVDFMMQEHIPGKMFNNDEIGDLIIYKAHRQYKVFIDGRLDMYGSGKIREYYKVAGFKPGWEAILHTYGISWIIFDTDSEFARFLSARQEWRLIYSDPVASIFVQNTPIYADLIARYPAVQLAALHDGAKGPK